MKTKKIPMRTCMACGEAKPKKELARIVKTPDGGILYDATGKVNGRGAYICKNTDCLNKAQKSKRLEHALETQISKEIFADLEAAFNNVQ